MKLWDYFAAHAYDPDVNDANDAVDCAVVAANFADALMRERERRKLMDPELFEEELEERPRPWLGGPR